MNSNSEKPTEDINTRYQLFLEHTHKREDSNARVYERIAFILMMMLIVQTVAMYLLQQQIGAVSGVWMVVTAGALFVLATILVLCTSLYERRQFSELRDSARKLFLSNREFEPGLNVSFHRVYWWSMTIVSGFCACIGFVFSLLFLISNIF
ncbi:MAG: hypothetical protein MI746_05180 [Pseudomonadales bacterium]|nr:hypothetical protein [Pseudomonadales bacterium]